MKKVRKILYVVAITSAIFAGYLSMQTEYERTTNYDEPVSNTIDSGIDGGAAGFAILSGLALVAASITYLKKEE